MALLQTTPEKSFAVSRINRMLGRIFALALVATSTEALVNAFSGFEHMRSEFFKPAVLLYGLSVVGIVISQVLDRSNNFFLRAHAILVLVLLLTWPLQCDPSMLPENYQPWIWWTLGMAMVAGATSFRYLLGVAFLIGITVAWFFLAISEFGANHSVLDASQESIFLFLFPTTLVAMVLALRFEAGKVDAANQLAIDSSVENARIDAIELERTRLDALVHDSVLTTLLVSANAQTKEQLLGAQKLAQQAIDKLRRAAVGVSIETQMTVASLFSALAITVEDGYPGTNVSSENATDKPVPAEIATAITEAILQALDNSVKHAASATVREVRLRGQNGGFKIVVSDNGRGFHLRQVPKDRLGLRNSIIGRVEGAGGKVFLNTKPGAGTTLIFEWGVK